MAPANTMRAERSRNRSANPKENSHEQRQLVFTTDRTIKIIISKKNKDMNELWRARPENNPTPSVSHTENNEMRTNKCYKIG